MADPSLDLDHSSSSLGKVFEAHGIMMKMPLFEFVCQDCKNRFEFLTKSDAEPPSCPKCKSLKTEKKVPLFRVGGRGDLRESTMHGCHDADPGGHHHYHHHDHSQSGTGSGGDSED